MEIIKGDYLIKDAAKLNIKKSQFDTIELIGMDEYSKYSIDPQDSTARLCKEWIAKIVKERGTEYIEMVYGRTKKDVNPFFIPAGEMKKKRVAYQLVDGYSDWGMCTNFSQAEWLKILARRMNGLRMDTSKLLVRFHNFAASDYDTKRTDIECIDKRLYFFQGARLIVSYGDFLLKRGSIVMQDLTNDDKRSWMQTKILIPSQYYGYLELTEDILFDDPSSAAAFTSGNHDENGWDVWKNQRKENLDQLRQEEPQLLEPKKPKGKNRQSWREESGKAGLDSLL